MMMRKNLQILFTSFFFFVICTLSALPNSGQNGEKPSGIGISKESVPIISKTVFPHEITLFEYENGLKLFVQRTYSQLASVRVYIRNTGSAYEGEWLGSGISHLTEHIVCGGATAEKTRSETEDILKQIGGSYNAMTSKDWTAYYIDCSAETIPDALGLTAGWVTRSKIDAEDVQREKQVIVQEMRDQKDNTERIAFDLLIKTVYRKTAYRHPVSGYPDNFQALTQDDVQRFYTSRYTPNNTIFHVAGNIPAENIAQMLGELYSRIPRGAELTLTPQTEPKQISPREGTCEMDVKMFRTILAWPTVTIEDEDAYPLDVLAVLLGGGASNRLNQKIRDDQRVGYKFSASSMTPSSIPGIFLIDAESRPEQAEAVQDEILKLLSDLSSNQPNGNEVLRAKKLTESHFIFNRETIAARADSCVTNYIITGDPNFDDSYLEGIRSVSPADISRVVKKYFKPEQQTRILIAPIGKAPSHVVQDQKHGEYKTQGVQTKTNGLRILTKHSSDLPTAVIQVHLLSGVLADTDANAGRSALLLEMLQRGTKNSTKAEIGKYLDSIGGTLEFHAGRNTISAKMTVLKEDYKQALALLADIFVNPEFSEKEFKDAKELQLQKILDRQSKTNNRLFELMANGLPENSPYHIQVDGTETSIKQMRLDDLKIYHSQILVPDRMVISVFGDIEDKEAVDAIIEYFGKIKRPENPVKLLTDRKNQFLETPDEHIPLAVNSGYGIAVWPGVSLKDEKEYTVLTVLQAILGGYGSPSGRLFSELRQDGLVYELAVDQMTGPAPGYFFIFFKTAPDKINEVFSRIENSIDRIKGGDLENTELERVKGQIIANRPHQLESLAAQAQQSALDNLYGFDYKHEDNFADRIRKVTVNDVVDAAQQYLTNPGYFSISPNETR